MAALTAAKPVKATGRVRTILGREVAHVWTKQTQEFGKNASNGNFYFEGPIIYSYGRHFPIAVIMPRKRGDKTTTVLVTTKGYSNSIAKHINYVRSAIPSDWMEIECNEVNLRHYIDTGHSELLTNRHKENIAHMLESIGSMAKKQKRARACDYRPWIKRKIINLRNYCKYFGVRPTKRVQEMFTRIDDPMLWATIADVDIADAKAAEEERARDIAEAERKREARAAADKAIADQFLPSALELFHAGEDMRSLRFNCGEGRGLQSIAAILRVADYTALRLNTERDRIETSNYASIEVETARRIWPLLKARQCPDKIEGYRGAGFRDDKLVVGCHRIPFVELEYIATQLGLEV